MALDPSNRDSLEKLIESAIAKVPTMFQDMREHGVKEELMVDNEIDYLVGYLMAYLLNGFRSAYIYANGSPPNAQIDGEAYLVIYNRLKSFRKGFKPSPITSS